MTVIILYITKVDIKAKLKIANVNVRSLLPSLNEIKQMISSFKFHILGITETWLKNEIDNGQIAIDGYNFFRMDRDDRGGGVGVYIRADLQATVLDIVRVDRSLEQLWLAVKISNVNYAIGVLYRPPSQSVIDAVDLLEDSVTNVLPISDQIILIGDINIDLLKLHNNACNLFYNFLESVNLTQIVQKATRITKTSRTLIDIIAVSNKNLVASDVEHIDMHSVSDHQLVVCNMNISVPKGKPKNIKYRDFKHLNIDHFRNDLCNLNWQQILDTNDVNQKVNLLTDNVLYLFDMHAPFRTVKISKPKAPWLTDVIKLMIKERNNRLSKFKKTNNPVDWEAYKELRNMVTSAIRQEKKAYLNFTYQTGNNKDIWRAISDINIYNKQKKPDLPDNLKRPDDINSFFINSVKSLITPVNQNLLDTYKGTKYNDQLEQFNFEQVTDADVSKAIMSIKSNASGADNITLQMVVLCMPVIVPFLVHIFNFCIINNTFPNNWKEAVVLPLPKTKDPINVSDLRPISLLSVFSKIFERLIYNQMIKFLTQNNLFPECQSGFRKGYSTSSALSKVLDDTIMAADKGKTTALILLDYSKAFDTLDHQLLCAKLNYYSVNDNVVSLVRCYLSNRSQYVLIDNVKSHPLAINNGVPQGSILGPLLFILYTMNLTQSVDDCSIHQYADDCQIYYSFYKDEINMAQLKLNNVLAAVYEYSCSHGLKINPSKTTAILFGPNLQYIKDNMQLSINQENIQFVEKVKNLGLIMDSKLRFREQINIMVRNSYMSLRNLYKSRFYLTVTLKKNLSEALVLSHTNYCDTVYGPCLDVRTKMRLQKIQNSCIRFIYNLRARDHVRHKLKELKWLNMENRRKLHLACAIHKLKDTGTPKYLKEKLVFRYTVHNINTRNFKNLNIPKYKTTLFQRCFSYSVAKLYNSIPNTLHKLSIIAFKCKYRSHLLDIQSRT